MSEVFFFVVFFFKTFDTKDILVFALTGFVNFRKVLKMRHEVSGKLKSGLFFSSVVTRQVNQCTHIRVLWGNLLSCTTCLHVQPT